MAHLVQVQTLRGTAGTQAATQAVQAAVAAHNATNGTNHAVHSMVALPPNTKGMQVHLSLLAQLARLNGCTLIRLSVHNGNVVLVGPQAAITATLAQHTATYSAMVTQAAATYQPATHGARMGFTNAYLCGLTAALYPKPATLQYGIGMLHTMPAPGNGSAYALGAGSTFTATTSTPATGTPATGTPATKRTRKVA